MADRTKQNANLKPFIAGQVDREASARAGKKGAEVTNRKKKEKKTLIEFMNMFLGMKPSANNIKIMQEKGIPDSDISNMSLFGMSLFENARKGNYKAMETMLEITEANRKMQLENEKLKHEIERLKLEQDKIKQDIKQSENFETFEGLDKILNGGE